MEKKEDTIKTTLQARCEMCVQVINALKHSTEVLTSITMYNIKNIKMTANIHFTPKIKNLIFKYPFYV